MLARSVAKANYPFLVVGVCKLNGAESIRNPIARLVKLLHSGFFDGGRDLYLQFKLRRSVLGLRVGREAMGSGHRPDERQLYL